jgi:hypothetical protein
LGARGGVTARISDETNETTRVRALLGTVDLTGAVVAADAAHASRESAAYIAGERARAACRPSRAAARHSGAPSFDQIQAECDCVRRAPH